MPRFALSFEYDGAAFAGTQIQPRQRTLQSVVDQALHDIGEVSAGIRFCSRLDQGVSALQLVGDCMLTQHWNPTSLILALAPHLPHDVVVTHAAHVANDWSALRACIRKTYRYHVSVRPVRPVLNTRSLWVKQLDHPELLHECAKLLIGHHDLSGFANLRHDDTDDHTPIRQYHEARWVNHIEHDRNQWIFHITGEGFLYKQVRTMVGAMLHVAKGRASIDTFRHIITHGRGAPRLGNIPSSVGLILEQLVFDPEPAWDQL